MCRYTMARYKPHYACFNCKKTFKRRLLWDINRDNQAAYLEAKCPQCGELMADMGLDFTSPKKNDIKQWEHLKSLYTVGITFHSCGCSGPGYIPGSKDSLIAYFNSLTKIYNDQLTFWRQRIEPQNDKEINREISKHWDFIAKVPSEIRPKKGTISNEEAKQYWFDRIKEVEQKLGMLKKVPAY